MCNFISFMICSTHERGLWVQLAHSLNSHSDFSLECKAYEGEWTENDRGETLQIRIPDDEPEGKREELKAWLLKQWPTWERFTKWAIASLDWKEHALDLRNTAITALPEGLSVGGRLDLNNTAITALPEGLSVGGSLYLNNTAITALPEGLSVGGWLDLNNTAITALPEGLSVGGWLYLRNTAITALPEGLSVGGSLYLRNTKIDPETIPDHLKNKVILLGENPCLFQ